MVPSARHRTHLATDLGTPALIQHSAAATTPSRSTALADPPCLLALAAKITPASFGDIAAASDSLEVTSTERVVSRGEVSNPSSTPERVEAITGSRRCSKDSTQARPVPPPAPSTRTGSGATAAAAARAAAERAKATPVAPRRRVRREAASAAILPVLASRDAAGTAEDRRRNAQRNAGLIVRWY